MNHGNEHWRRQGPWQNPHPQSPHPQSPHHQDPNHQGPWRAQGPNHDLRRDNGVWWMLGLVALGGVLVIAAIATFVVSANPLGRPGFTAEGFPPPTTSVPSSSSSPGAAAPSGNRPESFPPARRAMDLPDDEARHLGTQVTVSVSTLRYVVMDFLDEPIYNCVFSVDLENVSDQPLAVNPAFRSVTAPHAVWANDQLAPLAAGERSERVLGWDGLSPEEVGVTESECAGPVELTRLVVAPG